MSQSIVSLAFAILEVPFTLLLFACLALALVGGMWRWRRAAALGLALALGLFVLGIAVHSVHHLSDPAKAAECPVFIASQHISGTLDEPTGIPAAMLASSTSSLTTVDGPTLALELRSDLPRGPPAVPA